MKNKLLQSTIILIIGGLITKLLSLIIKIILTRHLSTSTLGQYMTLYPTFVLLVSISQFGLPTAMSKIVSENNRNKKRFVLSNLPILAILNIIMMILIFTFAPTITNLLQNKKLYLGIISIALVIPFTSISSLIRSYLFGIGKTLPQVIANIVESIIRLLIYQYYLPIIIKKKISYIICFLILSNVVVEITDIIVMLLFLPKNINIRKKDFIPNIQEVKDYIQIGIPTTITTIIGSIGYFLEPIILLNTLKLIGYSNNYINTQYGIITGYVIPLILLPSFFTGAISTALLPSISKDYSRNNIRKVKLKLKFSIILSLLIGGISTSLFIIYPELFLKTIYHTNKGINYIRILSPFFLFFYISTPISTTLDAIGKTKEHMNTIISATLIRTILLFTLSLFHIGLYSLIISTSINILYTTIIDYKKLKNNLS